MKFQTVLVLAVVLLLTVTFTLAFDVQPVNSTDRWPMFRHDLNNTGYSTSSAPNTNNTIWSFPTGNRVDSSPAVADGKVYVGSMNHKVYCLDASTGTHIWDYTTDYPTVHSSPAVADGKVYVGSQGLCFWTITNTKGHSNHYRGFLLNGSC